MEAFAIIVNRLAESGRWTITKDTFVPARVLVEGTITEVIVPYKEFVGFIEVHEHMLSFTAADTGRALNNNRRQLVGDNDRPRHLAAMVLEGQFRADVCQAVLEARKALRGASARRGEEIQAGYAERYAIKPSAWDPNESWGQD